MTVTGHRNEASVRSYVFDTTAVQKRQMSEALSDQTTKMTGNAESQTSSGLNDGFDDALCLSLSQTERVIQTILEFESELDKNTSNQVVLPIPGDNLTSPMNQEVSITNKSNVNIATNNTLPPVFNFNSCNIQFYNVSK